MPISPPPLTLEEPLVDGDPENPPPPDDMINPDNKLSLKFTYKPLKTDCAPSLAVILGEGCIALFCCPPCCWLFCFRRIPFIPFRVKDVWIPSAFYMLDMATLLLYMAYRINHKSQYHSATDTMTLVYKPVVTYAFVHLMVGIIGVVVDYQAASRSTYYFTLPHNRLFLPYLDTAEKSVLKIALTWGVRASYQLAFPFSLLLCLIEVIFTQIYKDKHIATADAVNSYVSLDVFMGEMTCLFTLFLITHRVRVKQEEKKYMNATATPILQHEYIDLDFGEINGDKKFNLQSALASLGGISNWLRANCCTEEADKMLPFMAVLAVIIKVITPFSVGAVLSHTSFTQ